MIDIHSSSSNLDSNLNQQKDIKIVNNPKNEAELANILRDQGVELDFMPSSNIENEYKTPVEQNKDNRGIFNNDKDKNFCRSNNYQKIGSMGSFNTSNDGRDISTNLNNISLSHKSNNPGNVSNKVYTPKMPQNNKGIASAIVTGNVSMTNFTKSSVVKAPAVKQILSTAATEGNNSNLILNINIKPEKGHKLSIHGTEGLFLPENKQRDSYSQVKSKIFIPKSSVNASVSQSRPAFTNITATDGKVPIIAKNLAKHNTMINGQLYDRGLSNKVTNKNLKNKSSGIGIKKVTSTYNVKKKAFNEAFEDWWANAHIIPNEDVPSSTPNPSPIHVNATRSNNAINNSNKIIRINPNKNKKPMKKTVITYETTTFNDNKRNICPGFFNKPIKTIDKTMVNKKPLQYRYIRYSSPSFYRHASAEILRPSHVQSKRTVSAQQQNKPRKTYSGMPAYDYNGRRIFTQESSGERDLNKELLLKKKRNSTQKIFTSSYPYVITEDDIQRQQQRQQQQQQDQENAKNIQQDEMKAVSSGKISAFMEDGGTTLNGQENSQQRDRQQQDEKRSSFDNRNSISRLRLSVARSERSAAATSTAELTGLDNNMKVPSFVAAAAKALHRSEVERRQINESLHRYDSSLQKIPLNYSRSSTAFSHPTVNENKSLHTPSNNNSRSNSAQYWLLGPNNELPQTQYKDKGLNDLFHDQRNLISFIAKGSRHLEYDPKQGNSALKNISYDAALANAFERQKRIPSYLAAAAKTQHRSAIVRRSTLIGVDPSPYLNYIDTVSFLDGQSVPRSFSRGSIIPKNNDIISDTNISGKKLSNNSPVQVENGSNDNATNKEGSVGSTVFSTNLDESGNFIIGNKTPSMSDDIKKKKIDKSIESAPQIGLQTNPSMSNEKNNTSIISNNIKSKNDSPTKDHADNIIYDDLASCSANPVAQQTPLNRLYFDQRKAQVQRQKDLIQEALKLAANYTKRIDNSNSVIQHSHSVNKLVMPGHQSIIQQPIEQPVIVQQRQPIVTKTLSLNNLPASVLAAVNEVKSKENLTTKTFSCGNGTVVYINNGASTNSGNTNPVCLKKKNSVTELQREQYSKQLSNPIYSSSLVTPFSKLHTAKQNNIYNNISNYNNVKSHDPSSFLNNSDQNIPKKYTNPSTTDSSHPSQMISNKQGNYFFKNQNLDESPVPQKTQKYIIKSAPPPLVFNHSAPRNVTTTSYVTTTTKYVDPQQLQNDIYTSATLSSSTQKKNDEKKRTNDEATSSSNIINKHYTKIELPEPSILAQPPSIKQKSTEIVGFGPSNNNQNLSNNNNNSTNQQTLQNVLLKNFVKPLDFSFLHKKKKILI